MTTSNRCDPCGQLTCNAEDDYGEFICDDCLQNRAESAWERLCEDFHDGGSTRFVTLQEQQEAARRLK